MEDAHRWEKGVKVDVRIPDDAPASFREAVLGHARFAAAGHPTELDDELREQLRSLGYIP